MSSPSPSASTTNTTWNQNKNPIAVRLYKVLGTRFDDPATKGALQTLSALYASPSSATEPTATKDDSDEGNAPVKAQQSPAVYETTPGETAARARKNLRRDMEGRLAEGSRQFLKAFAEIDQKLETLQAHVEAMHASCDDAETHLHLTNESSQTLLERAGNLRDERQQVEVKKSIVNLFLSRFTLSENEVAAITSRDVAVGKQFFNVMDKAERIRDDCRVLMSGEDGPTQAGQDIMSTTSSYLEQGYEKIFRWCSYEFRDASLSEVSSTMREAVRRLRARPELLTEALGVLSSTRQQTLLSSFITALTRGAPRPIELHAHDPMRYVGDMLAWVHQAIAAEREFLESLFDVKSSRRMVGSIRIFDAKDADEERMRELMDLAVGKLCVPLKVRVQQTVRSQESSIVSYKVANLLQFYMMTMRRTIGDEAVLSKTLQELTELAYNSFYEAIESQGKNLLRSSMEIDDNSLTPPISLLEHAQILREVMAVYQSSLIGDKKEDELSSGFVRVLDLMIDPAIELCVSVSDAKKQVQAKWDSQVFMLNCLGYLLTVLEPYSSFTKGKQKEIQDQIDKRIEGLTEEHYRDLLTDCGLSPLTKSIASWDQSEPLSHIPACSPSTVKTALHSLSDWLSMTDEIVSSCRLASLEQPKVQVTVHRGALERIIRAYAEICREVRRKENRYEAGATLLGSERPFGQAELLEQIFGVGKNEG